MDIEQVIVENLEKNSNNAFQSYNDISEVPEKSIIALKNSYGAGCTFENAKNGIARYLSSSIRG